jgi:hypothetical protein
MEKIMNPIAPPMSTAVSVRNKKTISVLPCCMVALYTGSVKLQSEEAKALSLSFLNQHDIIRCRAKGFSRF